MNLRLLIKGLSNRPIQLNDVTRIAIKKETTNKEFNDLPLEEIHNIQLSFQEYKFINDNTVVIVKGEDLKAIVAEL